MSKTGKPEDAENRKDKKDKGRGYGEYDYVYRFEVFKRRYQALLEEYDGNPDVIIIHFPEEWKVIGDRFKRTFGKRVLFDTVNTAELEINYNSETNGIIRYRVIDTIKSEDLLNLE